ncbi:choice-of-anchor F family protein [Haliea sp. E17]|uniref:choice-of-anchor F family protein n=1 Tax=Haliea sp. E17 TaxID=3401576 RepID=UPI003AB0CAF5
MNSSVKKLARCVKLAVAGSACALVVASPVMAGKITSVTTNAKGTGGADAGIAYGFGGWNLDNVEIYMSDGEGGYTTSTFDESSGSYDFAPGSDHTYYAAVSNGSSVVGRVMAKDWPIGEPSTIKVINDDLEVKNGRPANCIMSTAYIDGAYLDSTEEPDPVICSSDYQTHKRFKVAMLPEILEEGNGSVDLVFNVEDEPDAAARQYEVFQKINNWTNRRLTGFTIEVGFGVGGGFISAGDADLRLSVPDTLWDATQLANFSAGLFGPLDNHGQVGFYDDKTRAGFFIDEYGTDAGNFGTTSLNATRRLGSNYDELPRGVEAMNQFGYWLPNNALPYGIFFDDDGNPDTDAVLVAWYGYNPATEDLGWMRGVADKFVAVDDAVIEGYANSLLYTVAVIDDLVNVGLNYIVTVGDIETFPGEAFTIRISPTALPEDDPEAAFPPYVVEDPAGSGVYTQVTPEPWLAYGAEASVMLQPGPVFEIGEMLTARVGDAAADLDPTAIDEVNVDISVGGEFAETVTLYELGEDRGVFAALLPSSYGEDAEPGTVISMAYTTSDEDLLTATTTAVEPADPPVSYDLSVLSVDAPESVLNGLSRTIKVRIENDHQTLESASGVVRLTGLASDGTEYSFADVAFTLDPGSKDLATFRWTASLADPAVAQTVEWTAGIYVAPELNDGILVDAMTATSTVTPKLPKKAAK